MAIGGMTKSLFPKILGASRLFVDHAFLTKFPVHWRDLYKATMSQADFKRRLKTLMLRPENQVCSDCPERQPRWASLIKPPPGAPPGTLSMGAFCCLECSGSHRRLGVHVSFVRSVNLDQCKYYPYGAHDVFMSVPGYFYSSTYTFPNYR